MIVNSLNIDQINFWEGAVLLINKPLGFSSFKVVYEAKKAICNISRKDLKIGHAGTLDPLATGLLILCTGRMTKQIESFQNQAKWYSGKLMLGAKRPTDDLESDIDQYFPVDHINEKMMEDVSLSLLGDQLMSPPIHSAIKVQGRRAYQMAREGKVFQLEPKPIMIHQFDIQTSCFPEIYFQVNCSKGTYIRSLAAEFGKRLQSGAYLSQLQRDAIGDYQLKDAWDLNDFKNSLSKLNLQ